MSKWIFESIRLAFIIFFSLAIFIAFAFTCAQVPYFGGLILAFTCLVLIILATRLIGITTDRFLGYDKKYPWENK